MRFRVDTGADASHRNVCCFRCAGQSRSDSKITKRSSPHPFHQNINGDCRQGVSYKTGDKTTCMVRLQEPQYARLISQVWRATSSILSCCGEPGFVREIRLESKMYHSKRRSAESPLLDQLPTADMGKQSRGLWQLSTRTTGSDWRGGPES